MEKCLEVCIEHWHLILGLQLEGCSPMRAARFEAVHCLQQEGTNEEKEKSREVVTVPLHWAERSIEEKKSDGPGRETDRNQSSWIQLIRGTADEEIEG